MWIILKPCDPQKVTQVMQGHCSTINPVSYYAKQIQLYILDLYKSKPGHIFPINDF